LAFNTFAWAGAVAAIAVVISVPGAVVLGRRGLRAVPLLLAPLLLPTYFAYAAYTLLRAPGSPLGDWIARLSAGGDTATAAMAGRLTALAALSLWSWPLASLVIGTSLRRLDASVLDALRLEASAWRRRVEIARLVWPGVAGAFLLVLVVMLGSAVPFHLGQVKTSAILTWLTLQQTSSPIAAWPTAWPSVIAAVGAAWWISGRLGRVRDAAGVEPVATRSPGLAAVLLGAVWVLSVVVPLVLFGMELKEPAAMARFWPLNGGAVSTSAGIALGTAFAVGGVSLLAGAAVRGAHSWARRAAAFLLITAGLVPGILVGSAWSIASLAFPQWIGDSPMVLVLAHASRFAIVGVLAGAIVGASEPRELEEARQLDGAGGLFGWIRTAGRAGAPLLVGATLIAAALSFHEIESSVLVQPPGLQNLAQRLLNDLHQLRMDAMSAAAIWLVAGGLVFAIVASRVVSKWDA
ncbi:MAG: hypothetical protein ACOYN0_10000, partial [Phycisphaerales bacterium]